MLAACGNLKWVVCNGSLLSWILRVVEVLEAGKPWRWWW